MARDSHYKQHMHKVLFWAEHLLVNVDKTDVHCKDEWYWLQNWSLKLVFLKNFFHRLSAFPRCILKNVNLKIDNHSISWSEEYGPLSPKYSFKSEKGLPYLRDFLTPTTFILLHCIASAFSLMSTNNICNFYITKKMDH